MRKLFYLPIFSLITMLLCSEQALAQSCSSNWVEFGPNSNLRVCVVSYGKYYVVVDRRGDLHHFRNCSISDYDSEDAIAFRCAAKYNGKNPIYKGFINIGFFGHYVGDRRLTSFDWGK